MKIIAVRIHNLASLVDAEVDFTQAPLKDTGLFAITGDTGAGKSTFLDAICLALYAKTARLGSDRGNKIEFQGDSIRLNDARNLLRRGTATGYAEVDFIAQDKQSYRARWSVNRSRGKSNGKLQAAQHTLQLLPENTLVASEKSKTVKTIESKIGLTFDQFSRAVLLAQHEFAAFLKATGDERAQLLECLTGTDKFSLIGKLIFERHKEHKDRVELLKASLSSYTLLTAQELNEKTHTLEQLSIKIEQGKQALAHCDKSLAWYKQAAMLEQALQDAQQKQQHAQRDIDDIAPQTEQAKQALAAQVIKENRLRFNTLSEQNAQLQQHISSLKSTDHSATIGVLNEQLDSHSEQLKMASKEKQSAVSVIAKARELDSAIALHKQTEQALNTQYNKQTAATNELQAQLEQHHSQQQKAAATTTESQQWLNEQQQLAPLAKDWSYYKQSLTSYLDIQQQLKQNATQQAELAAQRSQLDEQLAQQNKAVDHAEQQHANAQTSLQTLSSQINSFNLTDCDTQLRNIEYLKEQRARYKELTTELKQSSLKQQQLQQQLAQNTQNNIALQQQLVSSEQAVKSSEYALAQANLRASESVEQLRLKLQPQQPCLVCGATEHPYAASGNPQLDHLIADFEQAFNQAKREFEQLNTQHQQLNTSTAVLQSQLIQLEQSITTANAKQLEISQTMQAVRSALNDLTPEQLDATHAQLSAQKAEYFTLQQQQQTQQKTINTLNDALKSQQQKLQTLNTQHIELTHKHSQYQNKQAELQQQSSSLTEALNTVFEHSEFWLQLQKNALSIETLQQQVMLYQQTQAQCEQAQQQQKAAEEKIAQLQPIITEQQQALASQKVQLQENSAQIKRLEQERLALFNQQNISADAYQAKLDNQVEHCQSQLTHSQKALDLAIKQRDEHAITLHNKEQRWQENSQEISALEQRYSQWFNDFKTQYSTATHEQISQLLSLNSDDIKQQLTQFERLSQLLVDANANLKQQQNAIAQHQLSDKPKTCEAELITQQQQLNEQQTNTLKQQLELNTALAQHKQNAQALSHKQTELAGLQQQLEQWHVLNKVLGDATGKTMRNLAQTQTLKVLLHYANSHLRTLNKRYQLTAIEQSLDIAIIDHDMADEQRSVNTLSGGESFLVSLALALGLASLSSNKVQINSLFIDEGFGTLDSETLSVAMDALDSLQAQGRKVGVISHVSEMSERVATQIHVSKKPGGYSTVNVL